MHKQTLSLARTFIELQFERNGECQSCGWHASLEEHDISDQEIEEALNGDGILHLTCQSKNDEDRASHRGIEITLLAPKT